MTEIKGFISFVHIDRLHLVVDRRFTVSEDDLIFISDVLAACRDVCCAGPEEIPKRHSAGPRHTDHRIRAAIHIISTEECHHLKVRHDLQFEPHLVEQKMDR